MLQFRVGDRVRISHQAPLSSGMTGTIITVHNRETDADRFQEYEVDLGTHKQSFQSSHLENANTPSRFLLGEMLGQWTMLTRRETEECLGDREKLVQLLQHRCGFGRRRAEQEFDLFLLDLQDKLRRAA